MPKIAAPVIFRASGQEESPIMKSYKHTAKLNIDNKIALFENHA